VAVDVLTEITISRPTSVVAAYAAPSNAPAWYKNIKSIDWQTDPPLQVGSRIAFVAHFLGRRLAYTYEVMEFVPDKRLVMHTAQGPFPMETTYTWEAIDGEATRMTLRNRGEPSGFSKLAAPFMTVAMRRANRKDLAKLRSLLVSARRRPTPIPRYFAIFPRHSRQDREITARHQVDGGDRDCNALADALGRS
jgi:hypothetical protein